MFGIKRYCTVLLRRIKWPLLFIPFKISFFCCHLLPICIRIPWLAEWSGMTSFVLLWLSLFLWWIVQCSRSLVSTLNPWRNLVLPTHRRLPLARPTCLRARPKHRSPVFLEAGTDRPNWPLSTKTQPVVT